MKPMTSSGEPGWISVDELLAEHAEHLRRDAYRFAILRPWLPEQPAHGLRVDLRRIGDRFLELLAEQNRPRLRTRPVVSRLPGGGFAIVDEVHEWREVGYTDGGGTLWHAPLRRDRVHGWSKATPSAAVEEYREMMRAVVEDLADRSDTPRELLVDD